MFDHEDIFDYVDHDDWPYIVRLSALNLTPERLREAVRWLGREVDEWKSFNGLQFGFKDERDAILFKLNFG